MEDASKEKSSDLIKFIRLNEPVETIYISDGALNPINSYRKILEICKMNDNGEFEKCSLKKMEENASFLSKNNFYKEKFEEGKALRNILQIRSKRLNAKFVWSEKNIKRLMKINDNFIKCWETGFIEAKSAMNMLFERMDNNKDSFLNNYEVRIKLLPKILIRSSKTRRYINRKNGIYDVINYGNWDLELRANNLYDPSTKDDKNFYSHRYISKDKNWNTETFGCKELSEHYICYTLHRLCRKDWAIGDILKINRIDIEVNVSCQSSTEVF
ncbi:MAG: hypothetical protein FWG89_08300 [Treponema sp.]|nr:hypothetical protein [Treponema sp.]